MDFAYQKWALINKGADVNAKNNYGKTALDASIAGRRTEIKDLLIKSGTAR
ncbi:hypothetical protein NBG4_990006 [Candidatus Sulfobium mesophilum]|uniref:Uncharacterized protein n=1 Tax=Candidatus Sulfobium mesophilum TaxID=2016548 RepID=A0A2U3QLC0_9BACT|nr:hypothetical protein NBG4_990006 [Candidatus Sulfobium mesophilum]